MSKIFFYKVKERVNERYNVVSHYFRINNKDYLVNKENLDMLKASLEVPFFVETYALSRAEVGAIIRFLKEEDMIVNLCETHKKGDKYMRFKISFNPILEMVKYKRK